MAPRGVLQPARWKSPAQYPQEGLARSTSEGSLRTRNGRTKRGKERTHTEIVATACRCCWQPARGGRRGRPGKRKSPAAAGEGKAANNRRASFDDMEDDIPF